MDVLVIRHGKRPKIRDVEGFFNTKLNEEGRIKSQEFGKILYEKYKSIVIASSIIERCKETALYIGKGFEKRGGEVKGLVFPFENKFTFMSFVKDPFKKLEKNAKPVIDYYKGSYEMMLKGWEKRELEEFLSIEEVISRDLQAIQDITKIYNNVNALIVITHDIIVSAFCLKFCKKNKYWRAGFLEGIRTKNMKNWEIIKFSNLSQLKDKK